MLVDGIKPRGYCKGVIRAINIVKESSQLYEPLYILGMIVHNDYIVKAFEQLGVKTIEKPGATRLELLDEINSGTIIITAHGAGDDVFEKAKEKGLGIIDASCLDVVKSHELIKSKIHEGYEILYIGKKNHPEAEGVLSISSHIHLIQSSDDFTSLDKDKNYFLTNQTTMSLYDMYHLCEEAKSCLPHVTIGEEVCLATKVRQKAIHDMDEDIDTVIIVGDPHSNNTKKLTSIASKNKKAYMIESIEDLDIDWLMNVHHVGVSSGASTPTSLTNQIIDYIAQFDKNDPSTHKKPDIQFDDILK